VCEYEYKVNVRIRPVKVAERSNASTVFARSEARIVGSNPTQGHGCFGVCVYSVFVLSCV
jgi:hypothetical protein